MGARTLAVTVVGAVALGASSASQQTTPTFRSSADLVRLHVVVRDAEGRPVRGLTKADFALLDSSRPRVIDLFEEVARPMDGPPPIVPAAFPLDVADNRSARASRLVVIILDDMVVRPYLEKTKVLAREAVARLGADALIALIMTSGMDGVEATADHSAILRAIDRVGTPASKAPRIPQRFGSDTSHATLAETLLLPGDGNGCHLTLLGQAARMVTGPEATRRVFLYIGPYCGVDFFSLTTAEDPYIGRYRDMVESLRQADVALYALDPRGEMGFSPSQFPAEDITGDSAPSRYAGTRGSSPVIASQEALRDLAATTGGLAVTNSSSFDQGFEQIEDDLSHYYVLAFHDDDPRPNRYHAVDVKVRRAGATARFRPGYYSGRTPVPEDKDPLVRLSGSAIPTPDLPLRLFAVSEPRSGGTRVTLVLEVGWTGLEQRGPGGTWNESLDAVAMVAKVLTGKVERKWAVKRSVMVPTAEAAPRGFGAYQVVTQVDLPPGSYQFRVSARSLTTGKAGSVYLAAEIPKPPALSLGEILIGAINRVNPALAPSPAGVAPLPFPITLDRVFNRTERLRLFARAWRTPGSAPLAAKAEFIDATGHVVWSLDAPFDPAAQAIDTTVDLNLLAPGAYRVRLVIASAGVTAMREVSLVIRP